MSKDKKIEQRLLKVKEAAQYMRITEWAMRDLYREKLIPLIIIAKKYMFDKRYLGEFIEKNKEFV